MVDIDLVIADVDGTLVTPEKVLTDRARAAVLELRRRSVRFAVTSGRPPRGMGMLIEPLALAEPIAGFNGGMFVTPDMATIEARTIPAPLVPDIVGAIEGGGLQAWIYQGNDWYVRDPAGPHVDREHSTVGFPPVVAADFDRRTEGVVKIVGVSDDYPAVEASERLLHERFGHRVSAARSQPYYVDVTHPDANKGAVVERLSQWLGIPAGRIATIGDMPNDVGMFERSGLSIAMGNAGPEVQQRAQRVAPSNRDEGFAEAMERFVLGGHASSKSPAHGRASP